jgi:precorrin-2 dehydrogenase/sirohydrochlorin ferrochelatase
MSLYCPLSINLSNRDCLVIGGGRVALRKVNFLLGYNGKVTVVSPQLLPELKQYQKDEKITYIADIYRPVYLSDRFLVICATDDHQVNHTAAQVCNDRGILVNTVNEPGNCSFLVPAQLKRGLLSIAVSTGGASPALACRIRNKLKEQFGSEYKRYTLFLCKIRPLVISRIKDNKQRKTILEYLADSSFYEIFINMDETEAMQLIEDFIKGRGAITKRDESGVNKCKRW